MMIIIKFSEDILLHFFVLSGKQEKALSMTVAETLSQEISTWWVKLIEGHTETGDIHSYTCTHIHTNIHTPARRRVYAPNTHYASSAIAFPFPS